MEIANLDGQLVIDSRDIAEMVSRPHNDVLKDIRRIVDQLGEGTSSQSYFIESTYTNSQNKELPCFLLTKKGCELYGTRMTGAKGTQFAVAYIDRFNEMEQTLLDQQPDYHLPSTFKEALYTLAESVDENDKLKQKIESDREKVVLANAITTSDEGLLIEGAAKYMRQNGVNIGRDRLFKWLRGQGYLVSRQGREFNKPTQKSLNQGLMKIHAQQYFDSEGELKVNRQVVVTGKGLMFFINKFLHDGQLTLRLE
ncbi:phage regulatory protein/antirepressor Ant [Lysinibacillus sp. G4S2]|uniref:Rha family transcriptional regulator n=1 Tax=Lysinibacillus sp. G4S2 TaxID=3055859 RepID=UPI0025A02448|nr:phage regulatory protein/antirepressor Ant [Lysinibacillus sp. G4S2]MDM5245720.1 phage regulatory protein/antirepressor Ant [Lysinibacillus sp. G4S2]